MKGFLSQITSNIEGAPNLFTYYDSSNNPNFANTQINTGIATGATGGDASSVVAGTNYFSDGQKRGMALGSYVFVTTDYVSVGADVGHLAYVSALQATVRATASPSR